MNRAREWAVLVAVCTGLGAASLLGWPVGPFALAGGLLCVARPWLGPLLVAAPWPLVTLAVLLGIGGWVATGAPPRAALGVALIYLQVHRVLGRTGPADDRVALLLSGLMLVAAASASEDVAWFVAFGVWSLALPLALLPAGFRLRSARLGRLTLGLSLGTVLLAFVLFPLLPRVRSEATELSNDATIGFAKELELGTTDTLRTDDGEVFRVEADPEFPETPLYFRGVVLDRFDGRAWSSTVPEERTLLQPPGSWPDDAVILRFSGEAPEGVLFTAGQVLHVESEGRPLQRDRHGAWRLDTGTAESAQWMVVAQGPWGPGSPLGLAEPPRPDAYLQLPDDLDPRITELARTLRGTETDPRRIADTIADYLRGEMQYSRAPLDAGGEEPLATFLFERKTGHCEYFASAHAILLRAASVQSRVVNGFVEGEFDADSGDLLVRRYHAHAWTEVWVPGRGWSLIDATPGPGTPPPRSLFSRLSEQVDSWWSESVVDFDRSRQEAALWSAGAAVEGALSRTPSPSGVPWVGLVVLWSAVLALALLAERLLRRVGARLAGETRSAPRGPVDVAWRKARSAAEGLVGRPPAALPPLSVARWVGERDAAVSGPFEELAWLLYRVHHGGEDADALAPRARDLAQAVVRECAARGTR